MVKNNFTTSTDIYIYIFNNLKTRKTGNNNNDQ